MQQSKNQPGKSKGQPKKTRSQDSITSQAPTTNKILEAARRERAKVCIIQYTKLTILYTFCKHFSYQTGRRKSLSTSNLPAEIEHEVFTTNPTDRVEEVDEDDLELGMSGSVLSGTNDSQEVESDVPLDEVSFTSEHPSTRNNRKIR